MIKTVEALPATDGLQNRVARLARPYGVLAQNARHLSGHSSEALLASLLLELDETILPRQFELISDTGRNALLIVAGRRLIRIQSDHFTDPTAASGVNADHMLMDLRQILHGATKATLQSQRANRPAPGADPGVSVSALIAAGGLVPMHQMTPDPVPILFDAISGRLLAWQKLDGAGNKTENGGDLDLQNRLDRLVRDGLADIEAQMAHSLSDPTDPGCILLSSGEAKGMALLFAKSPNSKLLALLPTTQLSAVQPVWNAFHLGSRRNKTAPGQA